jgi:hypothetical protein
VGQLRGGKVTDKIAADQREKFEEWARSTGTISWLDRREDGAYESGLTQLQWEGYQAGFAAGAERGAAPAPEDEGLENIICAGCHFSFPVRGPDSDYCIRCERMREYLLKIGWLDKKPAVVGGPDQATKSETMPDFNTVSSLAKENQVMREVTSYGSSCTCWDVGNTQNPCPLHSTGGASPPAPPRPQEWAIEAAREIIEHVNSARSGFLFGMAWEKSTAAIICKHAGGKSEHSGVSTQSQTNGEVK